MSETSAEAKNLKAIAAAIVKHNGNCTGEIVEILLNPFEHERLGWDDFQGIPLASDQKIGTGRFHLVCSLDVDKNEKDAVESVDAGQLVTVGGPSEYEDLERREV